MIEDKFQNLKCKICESDTEVYGIVDFNKSCEELNNKILPCSGKAIYYHQCTNCKFIFTIDFDNWSLDDFSEKIYNDDYHIVDPEYWEIRPKNLANWIQPLLNDDKTLSIFDYGAGTGVFGDELENLGYTVDSWDPLWETPKNEIQKDHYDVVTAFEVLQHSTNPLETAKELAELSKKGEGQLVIMTLSNDIIRDEGVNYWYLAPRNGHVCMYSNDSLQILFDKVGMSVQHLAPNTHIVSWK